MSKRRTRKEKIKAQLTKPRPAPPAEEEIETSLIFKDWLKTGLITLGLLFVLGMIIIFLKP
jgi:hypothetical protein